MPLKMKRKSIEDPGFAGNDGSQGASSAKI
jgi:hypothetical protein